MNIPHEDKKSIDWRNWIDAVKTLTANDASVTGYIPIASSVMFEAMDALVEDLRRSEDALEQAVKRG